MAIYDDLQNIIKGNRGDRLDMMIPLLLATVSTLADARWQWIGAPSITVFLGVFGLVYAIWRIIAICLKKLSGEWYRDRFLELVSLEIPDRGRDLREFREALLKNKESERRILSIVRSLRAEETIWHKTKTRKDIQEDTPSANPEAHLERIWHRIVKRS